MIDGQIGDEYMKQLDCAQTMNQSDRSKRRMVARMKYSRRLADTANERVKYDIGSR